MRERCPVAYSTVMGWSLFRHEDVARVLHDHTTFSNAVSRHRSVPNGMDPPEHTVYRNIIEKYFSLERIDLFEPFCREIVAELIQSVVARGNVELMSELALLAAVRTQCAFLGWPVKLHGPLIEWTRKNSEAALAQDQHALSTLAREFQDFIVDLLEQRRQPGVQPEDDVTAALMQEKVGMQSLSDTEISSILRNWTVGEIGTIAAAIGILVHYLAQHPELQERLRAQPSLLPLAIDEMLRIHGPLIANRRITTRAVEIGGRAIDAGERISLNWISANRDDRVFDDANAFSLDRDPTKNLLYGAGIHVCPGAPLARMQLRVTLEELLKRSHGIALNPDSLPALAVYPASGFSALPMRIS